MGLLGLLLFVTGMFFVLGACIGSFLNVVILRSLSNESIVWPGSKCPKCQKSLKWYHNIPILSFLFLRGKCAFCGEKISIQYPLVEFFTGCLFVLIFLKFGISLNALFLTVISALMIVLAGTDIKEKVVFDVHTFVLVGVGLVYNFFSIGSFNTGVKVWHIANWALPLNNSLTYSVLGIVVGIVIMELMARFGYLVAGTRAFGEGDTYIAAGLGAVFGWSYLLTILLYSIVIQVIATIPPFFKKLYLKKDYNTLISFIAFFVYVVLFRWLVGYDLVNNDVILCLMTSVLLALGFYVCFRILKGLKSEENRTYMPFGPAMVLAAFILMFVV